MNTTDSSNSQSLTLEQLEQAKQFIINNLSQVLEQSPEFLITIGDVIAEEFPDREEFARLLEFVEAYRRETQQHKREGDDRGCGPA